MEKMVASLGVEYKKYVQGFMRREPNVFHMSDGMLSRGRDKHINVGKGEYDFRFLMGRVEESDSAFMTLETPRIIRSLNEDMENLSVLKNI